MERAAAELAAAGGARGGAVGAARPPAQRA